MAKLPHHGVPVPYPERKNARWKVRTNQREATIRLSETQLRAVLRALENVLNDDADAKAIYSNGTIRRSAFLAAEIVYDALRALKAGETGIIK